MFNKITPEQAGISSKAVAKYINYLEKRGVNIHGMLMMKGDDIFAEYYWEPFHKDFCHRMYSQTKSYVGIAIGLLIDEGKLSLDDKMYKFFSEKTDKELSPHLKEQTIREMLTMTTVGTPSWWFTTETAVDRTKHYLENSVSNRPSGTFWEYDSAGSQVLSSLVEKLSGKTLLEYMKEKLFNKMGTFKTAEILKTRNGDSWGDSALICTLRDMASFGRLLMKNGNWNGEQLISEDYVKEATSAVVCNDTTGFIDYHVHGYGYQIWRFEQNSFGFTGMGCQLTFCVPDKDLFFTFTSDNQGYGAAGSIIANGFFDIIVDNAGEPMEKDADAEKELAEATADLKLSVVAGNRENPFAEEINRKRFVCKPNPMGITEFSLSFKDDQAIFNYTNAQGEKEIKIGIGRNIFQKFPQLGYSNDFGGTATTDGFMYDCAASGAWREDKKFVFRVQIIDRYFGNFMATVSFKDNYGVIKMVRTAENFLTEYEGIAVGELS